LLKRVLAHESPQCCGDDPLFEQRSSGSRGFVEVEVELRNGTTDRVRIDRPPGHPARELSWEDLQSKFTDCARQAGLAPERARCAFDLLTRLEQLDDVSAVLDLLC
jgi:2-methylcitrate dehydratase PrpD